ncbi:MAG: polysaccharide deacetylase family protein [Candidatus Roizmanbacteria bacterium]|nr:polysaccharide deacetylase family protein [Candidatus Roizmanbacteria bacterium]
MKDNLISISIDDGHPLDLKTAEILKSKNIKAIFYIPIKNNTGRPTLGNKQIKELSQNPGFEIGGHTYNHVDLTKVPLKKAEEEMRTGKEALEDIIGKKVTTFAWPWGKYNRTLLTLATKVGFKNTRATATINFNEVNSSDLLWYPNLLIKPHSFISDMRNTMKRLDVYSTFRRVYYSNLSHMDLLNVIDTKRKFFWFHSWEIDKFNMWDFLKNL